MLDKLEELIKEEKWEEAREYISKIELEIIPSDRFAIFNAMVYMEEGRWEEAYKCITIGIICNSSNDELYSLLGDYYLNRNVNQAYLCYEQALFYCCDDEGRKQLEENMEFVRGLDGFEVHPVSFVIPSYNGLGLLKECIGSIRKNHAGSMYELVVVDNASADGSARWLREQQDLVLQCNSRNEDYIRGCNQGIRLAAGGNDIFLLDQDTLLPPNALFWLRMGLYERETVGAVGPVTNNVSNTFSNSQVLNVSCDSPEKYLELAESIHIPMQCSAYENKIYITGFAMLVKRRAVQEVGLFDERYECGGWEDVDYGMMLSAAGYECLVCKNAFIYHAGDTSVDANQCGGGMQVKYANFRQDNYAKLVDKWDINALYYMGVNDTLFQEIREEPDACFRVLDVDCGCGTLLSHIKWKYPNAGVYGIELMEKLAKLGKHMADIMTGNIETLDLPYAQSMFDYIILGDILEHLTDPYSVIQKLGRYLKTGGKVIASIPNLLNKSVLAPLLRGSFLYADAGLLDATHRHLFTKQEIVNMFSASGFRMISLSGRKHAELWRMEEGDEALIDALCKLPGVVPREELEVYQYCVAAERI